MEVPRPPPASDDDVEPPDAGTGEDYEALHTSVLALLGSDELRCAGCHNNEQLNLATGSLTDFAGRLVSQPSGVEDCEGELLVDPERPERSLLLQLVDTQRNGSACLAPMPLGTNGISATAYTALEAWVDALIAVHDGEPVASAPIRSDAADPADPFTVLRTTKYLIDGGAVTAEELASARDAEGRLVQEQFEALVRQWLAGPNFEAKRKSFFELALQQNPASGNYAQQLRNTNGVVAGGFVDTLEASWIRTAERMYQDRDDFRSLFYTTRQQVTTATLIMLKMTDNSLLRNHLGRPGRDTAMNDAREMLSANYAGRDDPLYQNDVSDWRTVELRFDPSSTDMRLNQAFADGSAASVLRQVPDGGSVTLRVPRTLCSSLAFFQMWPTNRDNRFRALVNQCLIVTLGKTFATADPTAPDIHPLPGVREQEGTFDPECMGCHKNLDPMLSAFEARFDYEHQRYRPHSQEAADYYIDASARLYGYTPGARGLGLFYSYEPFPEPYFSFRGVNAPGPDLLAVVRSMALHPDFSIGWAMKVCQWSASIRCDRNDPELIRVAQVFADSGHRLDQLFEAYFTSKLMTHTYGESTSYPGAQVSISRRAHYCHALDVRLKEARRIQGLDTNTSRTDICGRNRKLASAIPEGSSLRGATDFSLPRSNSTFSSISISNLCSEDLDQVVGRGNRTFDRDGGQATIALMVEQVLGYPRGTQLHEDAADSLNRVFAVFNASSTLCTDEAAFEAALETSPPSCGIGLSNQDAMESVFSLVCQNPALTTLGL